MDNIGNMHQYEQRQDQTIHVMSNHEKDDAIREEIEKKKKQLDYFRRMKEEAEKFENQNARAEVPQADQRLFEEDDATGIITEEKLAKGMQRVIAAFSAPLDVKQSEAKQSETAGGISDSMRSFLVMSEKFLSSRDFPQDDEQAQELKKTVEDLRDIISEDMEAFEARAGLYFEEQRVKEGVRGEAKTWEDVLSFCKTEYYEDGKDGVTIDPSEEEEDTFTMTKDGKTRTLVKEQRLSDGTAEGVFDGALASYADKLDMYRRKESPLFRRMPPALRMRLSKNIENEYKVMDMVRDCLTKSFSLHVKSGKESMMTCREFLQVLDTEEGFKEFCKLAAFGPEKSKLDEAFKDTGLDAKIFFKTRFAAHVRAIVTMPKDKSLVRKDKLTEIKKVLKTALMRFDRESKARDKAKISAQNTSISKRNVATTRLARLFGIPSLVMQHKMREINIGGSHMRCVEREESEAASAQGAHFDLKDMRQARQDYHYSPQAVHDMTALEVLDIISGQVERSRNDVRLEFTKQGDEVYMTGIKGINNELCYGRITYQNMMDTNDQGNIYNLRKIERKGRPAVDQISRRLAERIMCVTPQMLEYCVIDILSPEERRYLKERFLQVQAQVRNRLAAAENGNRMK